jgi:addiction module HigA family antidote
MPSCSTTWTTTENKTMIQRNPPHPGSLLREDVLPALHLTVSEAAEQLGVSRATLSRVINEHAAISPEMAARLEQWTTGPSALGWLQMQVKYDMWQLRAKGIPKVAPARPGVHVQAA